MIRSFVILAGFIVVLLYMATQTWAGADADMAAGSEPAVSSPGTEPAGGNGAGHDPLQEDNWEEDNWEDEWEDADTIADPLEPINRFFFHFNDKLYYWVLKPVAKVYSRIFTEDFQVVIRNFFDNLRSPARAINSLLQGNVGDSSKEMARFVLNSTVGIIGVGDFAGDVLGLHPANEDFGQTLAYYGAGGGFYINWPFLGPSNFRDSLGILGDSYVHPLILLNADREVIIGAWTFEKLNYTALTLGDYELFTQTALDPYTAVKDAYQQYRNGLIKNR
jgi:phospholipid-binding lipoprotein MlaA